MPNEAVPGAVAKPTSSPILDRFRDLLRERDEELRASTYDGVVPPPTTNEIVRMYEDVLSELTFNSKPIITDLTIIAGEQRAHGEGIADAVCARILEVPVEQKLPSLYLLDSIVKNIGREYVRFFSSQLPEVFCDAYRQVHPDMHPAMQHLFRTWSTVFPSSVLHMIEVELQFSPLLNQQSSGLTNVRASQSPRPAHGIHVNPKYLETRGQSDSETASNNVNNVRGVAMYKTYGQKSTGVHDDYESDQGEGTMPNVAPRRLISGGYGGRASLPLGSDKLLPSLSSPARVTRGNGETVDWRRSHGIDNINAYSQGYGHKRDRTRALIDAYGQDNGQRMMGEHPHKVGSRMMNDIDGKRVARQWQHTEEEEFDWEDINPSLVDQRGANVRHGNLRPRLGGDLLGLGSSTPNVRRSWHGDTCISTADDCSKIAEDVTPLLDVGHGSVSKLPISQESARKFDPVNPQGTWNLSERTASATFPASSVSSSASDRLLPHVNRLPDTDAQVGRFSNTNSRSFSSRYDLSKTGALPPVQQANFLNPQVPPSGSTFPSQKENSRVMNQGPQQFNGGNMNTGSAQVLHLPTLQAGMVPSNSSAQPPVSLQQQFLHHQDPRRGPIVPPLPSQAGTQPLSQGYAAPAYGVARNNPMMNPIPVLHPSVPSPQILGSSFQQGAVLPPVPSGPLPVQSQILPLPQLSVPTSNASPGIAYPGLINSLVAQGLISLTNQTSVQDSLGVDFNQDLLKVRHESAIKGLYADLPRQCTTCGLRFKTQEEHSKHMDWHVTKNRVSKNRKQNPSRKWFVSMNMWLSGAEALGTDAAPGFFLQNDVAEEKQDEEEFSVPADEDQKTCALCGEPFEDFYSDETDEWMYRGAVYLNAPGRSTAGMDRSQLGPIVHAKCRSDSSVVPT